jgi:hypothetical protein
VTIARQYYKNGKKDALGSTINETSLKYLLRNCNDFINKELMLQYYGRLMGVTVDQTPKCHSEMAGEGIEYSWAAAKNKFHEEHDNTVVLTMPCMSSSIQATIP